MKLCTTIRTIYCTGHEFTDYIELTEQDYSLKKIKDYMDWKARERGFKGYADIITAEFTTTLK